jgi:peptidoglycan/LPS O-acetylase OafA/YrhL
MGLRAIAALTIVVYHTWLYSEPSGQRVDLGPVSRFVLPYLPVGVTLFFCLSAFLLYRPVVDGIIRGQPRQSVGAYLRNRALRIIPAYWLILLVLGVVLGAGVIRLSSTEVGLGRPDPALLLLNLGLVQNYVPATLITGIPPAWSLAVEVAFYLVLPLLAWMAVAGARRAATVRGRTIAVLAPAVLLLFVGLSGKAAALWLFRAGEGPAPGWDGDWHSVLVRSFWAQADLFSFGMALAVVWVCVEAGTLRLPGWWRIAAAATLVPIVLSTTRFGEGEVLGASAWASVLALGCTLLLALVVLVPAGAIRRSPLMGILETRLMVGLGLISYSLFLWHEPLVRWLALHGVTLTGRLGFVINVVIVSSLSALLAVLTYRFVERPALRHKERTAAREPEADVRTPAASEPSAPPRAALP